MNNLAQLLREADPLRHEDFRLDAERARLRAVISAATPAVPSPSQRTAFRRVAALTAVALVALVLAYASDISWTTPVAAQVRFEVRLAEDRPVPGLVVAQVENTRQVIYLHPETVVSNEDIASAAAINGTHGFAVEVHLLPSGADRLRQATGAHIGRRVAILLDGRIAMAPTVRSPIGDSAVITGQLTEAEARRIAEGVSRP
jgi:hypothetical protein